MKTKYAPVGMHYVVFEIWSDGSEHLIFESKDRDLARCAVEEAWKRLSFFPKVRIGFACVDD